MKKIIILLIVFTSCDQINNQSEILRKHQDSLKVDSIQKVEAAIEQKRKDSIAKTEMANNIKIDDNSPEQIFLNEKISLINKYLIHPKNQAQEEFFKIENKKHTDNFLKENKYAVKGWKSIVISIKLKTNESRNYLVIHSAIDGLFGKMLKNNNNNTTYFLNINIIQSIIDSNNPLFHDFLELREGSTIKFDATVIKNINTFKELKSDENTRSLMQITNDSYSHHESKTFDISTNLFVVFKKFEVLSE